jgi:hypothetical protein
LLLNSFAMSGLAALALRLKMGAEETSVIWLNRHAEQAALEGRPARFRRAAVCFSTEIRAVLADTKVRMRSTRSYSGQYLVQGVVHRGLLLRVERVHGAHQDFERIARNRCVAFARQAKRNASPIRLGSLSDQIATCLKRLDGL